VVMAHIRMSFAGNLYPRRTEWLCAGLNIGMGILFMLNPTLMAVNYKAYSVMLAFMTQHQWANFMVIFGAARIIVLIVNGAWRKSPHIRSFMAVVSCLPLWTAAWSFTPYFGLAMLGYWAWLITDIINAVVASSDAKESDSRAKHERSISNGR